MYKRKLLNYITIICAISTVGMALYSSRTIKNNIMCFVMLIITITVNYFSNKCNEKDIDLTKEDKEKLEKLKEERNRIKKNRDNKKKKDNNDVNISKKR